MISDTAVKIKSKFLIHLVKTLLASGIVFAVLFAVYFFIFLNKTLPNTYFGPLDISGKSNADVEKIAINYLDNWQEQKIKVEVGSKEVETTLDDLGIKLEYEPTLNKIYGEKHPGNFFEFIKNYTQALIFKKSTGPVYRADANKFVSKIDSLIAPYERQPKNSTIIFDKSVPKISASGSGVIVDRAKLTGDLAVNIDNMSDGKVIASYVRVEPKIRENQAEKALEKVKQLSNANIVLYFGQEKWPLSGKSLVDLLEFGSSGEDQSEDLTLDFDGNEIVFVGMNFAGGNKSDLEIRLNNEKVDAFISQIADDVNKPTVDATIEFDGTRVTKFSSAQDGQQLNRELTKKLILEKISVGSISSDKNISIKLPVEVTPAKIANKEINNLGVRELIGSGISYFAGSIPNRASNIALGASLINGTLVKPGEVFSFDKLVGPVSAEQGFKQAYVINKGRTVLDDGGGICQVSTTVFRAALNTGLPIVARTAHAYRVSYYEQGGFGPGLDATVFSPSVDLQFKNDTEQYVLVQTIVDRARARLQIDIYGTRDGRRVEIGEPVVTNVRPAPDPLYQDDPTLPKGTVKQVDFAAKGANSVFTRKVYKNDQLIIDESFKSNFRPWQAVYLVGTGG